MVRPEGSGALVYVPGAAAENIAGDHGEGNSSMKLLAKGVAAIAVAVVLGLMAPAGAGAQPVPIDTATAVERVFRADTVESDWFVPAFLAQVPAVQVEQLIAELIGEFGPLIQVIGTGRELVVRLERADLDVVASLDPEGRFDGLLIRSVIPTDKSVPAIVAEISALPGETSVLVLTEGVEVAAHEPDALLGVGSAAKLAILKALNLAVGEGRLAWDQVVPLDPAWTSLPSGILHFWPPETPLTLATLANLMMSMSDNTATDGLITIVGREAIEALSPRNTPFLQTNELFRLKVEDNEALLREYAAADVAGKQAVLARVAAVPLPNISEIAQRVTPEIEWFLSVRELCGLLDDVAGLPAMTINPGLARIGEWATFAYKGGSEPGVLNYTTRVVGHDGRTHCVAATWNDTATLEEDNLTALYRALLSAVRE